MRKLVALSLIIFSFLCLTTAYANTHTEGLLVLLSKQASIQPVKDKPGVYQLTLKGVNPKVIYFTDRPARVSGQIAITQLLNEWENGSFKKTPPNAMMEAVKLNAKTDKLQQNMTSYPMVLQHPVYSKKTDELTFEVNGLPKSQLLLGTVKHSDYVAVFIDGVCITCIHG